MLVALAIALNVIAVSLGTVLVARTFPWRGVVRRRVVVVLDGDRTIDGVLWRRCGQLLVLRSARVLTDAGAVPVDGDVVLERCRVQWIQVLS